ncbi:hypothetical protein K440DRAFT_641447 [Wilcoxina mikolae CBS 423.85]|nr:hypothetical protein K440DRAFT_641447 [Wilcoxina mikolae CBS 423.85]
MGHQNVTSADKILRQVQQFGPIMNSFPLQSRAEIPSRTQGRLITTNRPDVNYDDKSNPASGGLIPKQDRLFEAVDDTSRTVLIWSFRIGTTHAQVRQLLSRYGPVVAIRTFGLGDRFAVEFSNRRDAVACIQTLPWHQRYLKIKWTTNGQARAPKSECKDITQSVKSNGTNEIARGHQFDGNQQQKMAFVAPSCIPQLPTPREEELESEPPLQPILSVNVKDTAEGTNNYCNKHQQDRNSETKIESSGPSCTPQSAMRRDQDLGLDSPLQHAQMLVEEIRKVNQSQIAMLDAEVEALQEENEKLENECLEIQKTTDELRKEIQKLQRVFYEGMGKTVEVLSVMAYEVNGFSANK